MPSYNNQNPPGAGQTVRYALRIPHDATEPVIVNFKLQYRKFDRIYTDFFTSRAKPGDLPIRGQQSGQPYRNELPITTLAADQMRFPISGSTIAVENPPVDIPAWQRWNDYGIGLFLKGQGRAEPRQAKEAFLQVEKLNRFDGPLNLARTDYAEGRLDEAVAALERARNRTDPEPPAWTLAWLSGLINREQGRLAEAEQNFRSVLYDQTLERQSRGFDFSKDFEVINLLGMTLYVRAQQLRSADQKSKREALLKEAVSHFQDTLAIDSEDVTAHYQMSLLWKELGDARQAENHQKLHAKYKLDDNALDLAVGLARQKYPAANQAAEAVVIYSLTRPGAPNLPLPAEFTNSVREQEQDR